MAVDNGDVLRIVCKWHNSISGQVVNVFHASVDAVGGSMTDAAAESYIVSWFEDMYDITGLTGAMADNNVHDGFEVFNLTQNAPMLPIVAQVALNGANAVAQFPSGVAALVIARTAVSRRVGKKYLPPFGTDAANENGWVAGTLTAMNDFGALWRNGGDYLLDGSSMAGVVGSGDPFVGSGIVQAIGVVTPAYQRRRKRGYGA